MELNYPFTLNSRFLKKKKKKLINKNIISQHPFPDKYYKCFYITNKNKFHKPCFLPGKQF